MLQQVSEKLLGQFVESLEAKLAADSAAPEPAVNGAAPAPPVAAQPEAEPIDLIQLAGGSALKTYGVPILGAFVVAAVVLCAGRLLTARRR
jgi:uncharacterized protein